MKVQHQTNPIFIFLSLLTVNYTMITISNLNKLFVYKTLIIALFHRETLQIIQSTPRCFIQTTNYLKPKSQSMRDPLFDMQRMTRTIIKILMYISRLILYISIKTHSVKVTSTSKKQILLKPFS